MKLAESCNHANKIICLILKRCSSAVTQLVEASVKLYQNVASVSMPYLELRRY